MFALRVNRVYKTKDKTYTYIQAGTAEQTAPLKVHSRDIAGVKGKYLENWIISINNNDNKKAPFFFLFSWTMLLYIKFKILTRVILLIM